jgi:hypothetical protein
MSRHLTDRQVVDAYVAHRSNTDLRGIVVDRRPDEENRTSSDVDALAGHLAIEHTSVDTVDGQRRDGAQFMEVVAPLEEEIGPELGFRLGVIFPYEGVATGQDWTAMRARLRSWLLQEAQSLAEGLHSIQPTGFPFAFDVEKTGLQTGRTPGLFFKRYSPTESDLAERLRTQINRKADKLGPYRSEGKTTILIVESNDVALMNRAKLVNAISVGFPDGIPDEVDELWYADTSVPDAEPNFHALVQRGNRGGS